MIILKILITGSTSGLAYELGCQLSKRGHLVYFTTHTVKEAYYLRKKLKSNLIGGLVFKMDITTKDIELIDKLNIDVLINHAGIGIGGTLLYMDINDLRKNYEVNVFSSFNLLKRVYKNMEKNNIKGKIFVTGSLAGYLPLPFLGCYTSSKSAIAMLCNTIKKELEYLHSDISISLVEPGAYKTGFNQVMIDNKNKYLEQDNIVFKNKDSINKLQKNLFTLIEKEDYSDLINKIVKEIEKDKAKFIIRRPIIQSIFTKIYRIFH